MTNLNPALDDERTLSWLRAHVHAELALARWDAIYLLRQLPNHPDELDRLLARLQTDLDERPRVPG